MAYSFRFRRRSIPIIVLGLFLLYTFRDSNRFSLTPNVSHPTTEDHGRFWSSFHELLEAAEPKCKSPERIVDHPEAIGFKPDEVHKLTLPEHIKVETEDREVLKKAHSLFMQVLSSVTSPRLAYRKGTRGIVSTAGGSQLPVFVTSLHMIRRTGSKLPVELFVADASEYDEYVCEELFPTLNARCVVLDDILQSSPLREGLKKYQFKIFSLLFSSFEDVMFLDADAFPMSNPDLLFTSEPFKSKGMIIWPDFWQVTFHPSFFEITSQPVPTSFRHSSTESGQFIVSKKTHEQVLLLSTYYNFYGPSHYYPLLSQGHPGEGDKETFVPPALILNKPYYAVSTGPAVFGYDDGNGGWRGGVMMQINPIWDSKLAPGEVYAWTDKPNAPPNSFLTCHANLPKIEPQEAFGENGLVWTADGKPKRMWGSAENMIDRIGIDIEAQLWVELKNTACKLEGNWGPWEGKPRLCGKIKQFIHDMKGH
ncbi:hypothetical protein AJ80_03073 [Polytolypa hystricis UAMH7299]|uniref:Alpha-1,2-mannosyltransferase n=1 Tax=Polytolypa hystricis (strain UAMH7299) TaxID=1447883 RepID=A0A2B7YKC1_POLH7|nr:hypothetical protein AJ80_03073 [Polytolypa hystricis UAMH7299]